MTNVGILLDKFLWGIWQNVAIKDTQTLMLKKYFLLHHIMIVFALPPINEWIPLDISFHRCLCTVDNRYSECTVQVLCFSPVCSWNTFHTPCMYYVFLKCAQLMIDTRDTRCTYRVLCLHCCSSKVDNGWIQDWITAALFLMKILHNCIVSHC